MILTEYDENEFRDFLKEEAWNEGHKAGMEDGIERGMRTGLIEGTIKTCIDFQISKEQTMEKLKHLWPLAHTRYRLPFLPCEPRSWRWFRCRYRGRKLVLLIYLFFQIPSYHMGKGR